MDSNNYDMATKTKTEEMKNPQTIQDVCNQQKIPCLKFFCDRTVVDGKKKKKPKALPAGWTKYNYEKCVEENAKAPAIYNCYNINLRGHLWIHSNGNTYVICVIDVDAESTIKCANVLDHVFYIFGETHWTESTSKKMPHLYRLVPIEYAKAKDNNDVERGYDIRYTNVFESPDSELIDWEGDPPILNEEQLKYLGKPKKSKKVVMKKGKVKLDVVSSFDSVELTDFEKAILENISIEKWTAYDTWLPISNGIVNEKPVNGILIVDEYSKKAPNYGGLNDVIAKTSNASKLGWTWGTVMHHSKESNPEEYQKIINRFRVKIDLSDMGVAEMILQIKPDDFVFQDGILYYCDGSNPFWKYDEDDIGVSHKIYIDLMKFYNQKADETQLKISKNRAEKMDLDMGNTNGKNKEKIDAKDAIIDKLNDMIETVNDGIGHAKTVAKQSKYIASLKILLKGKQRNAVLFDTMRPYVFCFQDCNIDVRTGDKVEIKKSDYITKQVAYEWREPTDEEMAQLKEIIAKIIPNEDTRRCYLSVLWASMVGKQFEKLCVATGGGRNGKGVMNELFDALLTSEYFYTGNTTAITDNLKGGANQEIANMDNKRCILFSEPNDSMQIKLGNIKSLTGNTQLNARALYSKKTDVRMANMTIIECNQIPKIEGRIDAAATERFMVVEFVAHFTNDKNKLENMENCWPLNTAYKTDEFKQQYKFALFKYILSFGFKDIYESPEVKRRTKMYLIGCDDFLGWFNENYEITEDKGDVVKMIDLYKHFKASEMWDSIPKAERRSKWTKERFVSQVKTNIEIGFYFKDRHFYRKKNYENCLIQHKKKKIYPSVLDDSDDE